MSAGLSVAVKLANGRLAGVPGKRQRARKQEWEKQGRRIGIPRVKNTSLFSYLHIPWGELDLQAVPRAVQKLEPHPCLVQVVLPWQSANSQFKGLCVFLWE